MVSFDLESTLLCWPLWRTTAALQSDDVSLLRLLFSWVSYQDQYTSRLTEQFMKNEKEQSWRVRFPLLLVISKNRQKLHHTKSKEPWKCYLDWTLTPSRSWIPEASIASYNIWITSVFPFSSPWRQRVAIKPAFLLDLDKYFQVMNAYIALKGSLVRTLMESGLAYDSHQPKSSNWPARALTLK